MKLVLITLSLSQWVLSCPTGSDGPIIFWVVITCPYACVCMCVCLRVIFNICGATSTARTQTVQTTTASAHTVIPIPSQLPSAADATESRSPPRSFDLNQTVDTAFTDAELSSGVAPPTYTAAGNYKTLPGTEV